ncbi:MAG: hypothetical protein J7M25_06525 [Deltaproteobacteria bacterium]|nr:hypothetical protein [Deltaproteobacteria bacterium]
MHSDLDKHFGAFELFGSETLLRGFLRVGRVVVMDSGGLDEQLRGKQPVGMDFAKLLVKTGAHLLSRCGDVIFGVADAREISVVMAGIDEEGVDPRGKDLLCRLTSEASGKFSSLAGVVASFETKVYEFPAADLVGRYLEWRQATNDEWVLDRYLKAFAAGDDGVDSVPTSEFGREEKIEILSQHGVDFAEVPAWQRLGVGLFWQAGVGDGEPSLVVDTELPEGPAYREYLANHI